MTYEELKNRLTQVETALQSLGNQQTGTLDSAYTAKSLQELNTIKESILSKMKVLKEEETMFVSTLGGDTKAVKMDMKTAMDLKNDPAITAIDTAKGKSLKETDGVKFSIDETKAIAKSVGKSLIKALKTLGDEVARIKAHRLEEGSFDIHITYKGELGEDEFSFYITDDELHLVDFSFDKKLVEVGVKPSGEAIVNIDVLTNELLKHFRSLSEGEHNPDQEQKDDEEDHGVGYDDEGRPLGEGEGDDHHYIKVKAHDYKKAMAILDQNVDPTYVKMEVVDNDGAGNVIIYFIFKHEDGFDDMYDDSENPDSEFYQEPDEDPQAFIYDVVMDLRANDIELADHSADMDEALDLNDPVLMKMRVAKKRNADLKKVDQIHARDRKDTRINGKKRALIKQLKAKRADIEREMENDPETEPTGGPVADRYGDMLNKIDNAIEKAAGRIKPVDYDTAVGKVDENAIDPAEYGDIADAYLKGFNKPHSLNLDQLETLGRKIVKQIYKGDFAAAKAKHLSEVGFPDDSLFTFGFDLDEIQYVVDYLKANYSEEDYELHVGRGDTHPNAVTLHNPEMENDAKLGDLLDGAKGSDQTDYEDYRREEDDYLNNELEETEKVVKEYGGSASRDLDEIFGALGYRQGFDEFIEDNPGAVEALMEWIGSISEFRQKISNEYSKEEQENLGFYYGDDDDDEYNESTNESLNPEVSKKVNQFIKAMAKRYGYKEQDAVYAIMAALKQRDFDGVNEDLSMKVGKVVAIKKYNVVKNQKVPVDVKITDYIKKPGSKDFVEYEHKGKKRKVSIDVFKSILAESKKTLKEFTDNSFKGSEVIDDANKRGPDMFGKQIFADLLPKGVASENDAFEALKKHDKSGIKARMGQYAPMFVHMQYHNLEHEGQKYRMHQKQYYNSNFKDKDPDFNPGVSAITLMKVDENDEGKNLGVILVKTDQYVQDLRNLPGLGKRHMEEATRQDLGMTSSVSKRRAKAELKKTRNDGSKVYGLDKDGKRVEIKNINDVDRFKKFELDADLEVNEFDSKSMKAYGDAVKKAYGAHGVKVGDILTKDGKKGKVVKVMDDMANVDFGNGDVYGITFGRIKGKEITKEAAPGYKHDCAAKVVHETYGKGNCIPEKHTLVKEGKKYVVTHYDVLFENGKTVEDIPVSELDIKTTNEHWHKGYKKKKK